MSTEEKDLAIDEALLADEYQFRDAFIDVKVKENMSTAEVMEVDPHLGPNMAMNNSGAINGYIIYYKEREVASVFYDTISCEWAATEPFHEAYEEEAAIFKNLFVDYIGNDISSAYSKVRTPSEVDQKDLVSDIKESFAVWLEEITTPLVQEILKYVIPEIRQESLIPLDELKTMARTSKMNSAIDIDLISSHFRFKEKDMPFLLLAPDNERSKNNPTENIISALKMGYSTLSKLPGLSMGREVLDWVSEGELEKAKERISSNNLITPWDILMLQSLAEEDTLFDLTSCIEEVEDERIKTWKDISNPVDWEKKLDLWEEAYKPINIGGDGADGFHANYTMALEAAKKIDSENPQHYLWTVLDSDDGEKIVLSAGTHSVNVVDFCVCEKSWENDMKENELLEVVYFDFNDIEREENVIPSLENIKGLEYHNTETSPELLEASPSTDKDAYIPISRNQNNNIPSAFEDEQELEMYITDKTPKP